MRPRVFPAEDGPLATPSDETVFTPASREVPRSYCSSAAEDDLVGHVAHCNCSVFKEYLPAFRALPRNPGTTGALAPGRRDASDDHRLAAHRAELLPQTHEARLHAIGGADVDQHDVVLRMIDHPVEPRNQIGLPAAAQAALKDGELDPLAVSLHQLEHPPPPLGVG